MNRFSLKKFIPHSPFPIPLLVTYIFIRLFSFYFQPGALINTAVSTLILILISVLIIKRNIYGWCIVAGEIILGGIGDFLTIGDISLRTLILIFSLSIFLIQIIKDGHLKDFFYNNKTICYLLFVIYTIVIFSSFNGYLSGHNLHSILADSIPYLFLLYYFPLKKYWFNNKFRHFIFQALLATIIGNLIFVLFTFILFSSGHNFVHDNYYIFIRDIAGGKVTDLGNNFFRIVFNEQLLLIPILLYFAHKIINKNKFHIPYSIFHIPLLIILSINLSRIYILAYLVGLLFLFSKKYWKRWLVILATSILILIFSFTTIYFLTSHGQSLGWELFGLRIQSIASPSIEDSSLSRMLLLPKIWHKIKQSPIIGQGLGDTITVYSPSTSKTITTSAFDWGYLEIWDEMGILGLLIWLFTIGYLLFAYFKKSHHPYNLQSTTHILPMLIALLIINLTSPALFHILGIILILIIFVNLTTYHSNKTEAIIINNRNR